MNIHYNKAVKIIYNILCLFVIHRAGRTTSHSWSQWSAVLHCFVLYPMMVASSLKVTILELFFVAAVHQQQILLHGACRFQKSEFNSRIDSEMLLLSKYLFEGVFKICDVKGITQYSSVSTTEKWKSFFYCEYFSEFKADIWKYSNFSNCVYQQNQTLLSPQSHMFVSSGTSTNENSKSSDYFYR